MFVNLSNLLINKNRSPLKTPNIELFDETLDINSTENYELSIQVSPDGFSFCLLDTIRNKFVLIRAFEPEENKYFNSDKINELLSKDEFLTKRYKKVNVVMPSKKFTLIPAPLFDPAKKDEYFNFNHIKEDGNMIVANRISDPDAYLVFSVPKPVNDLINSFYPGVHTYHHIKPLFDNISHSRKSANGNCIHIHVEREFFNLIIFNNNLLKFCNTFNYRNISDILYFVLNVFKNLDIKQEETIYFSGLTEKYDDLSSNFSIYVRNIKFAEPSGNFTFSYVFNDMDLHRFLNLFSVVNCG
ncbi:MAG: DUF3822 family protein [Bacteroidota bacterium]